jgi:hypothetical protein
VCTVFTQPVSDMQAELDARWINTELGRITASGIRNALEDGRTIASSEVPNLSTRAWERIGKMHREVYELVSIDRGSREPRA